MTDRAGDAESGRQGHGDLRAGRVSLGLWFGMLGGPFAAVCDGTILYATVSRACQNANVAILHLICSISMLVAVAGLITAHRMWQRAGGGEPNDKYGVTHRVKFMSVVGLMSASLGILGILMEWYPIFIIGPCTGA